MLPGAVTPSLQEDLVRLATWMPFGRVVGELKHFRDVDLSKSSVVRLTERAGAAYVEVQEKEVDRIEREVPEPPPGPAQQFLSVDGAMIPLVGGEWAEVKTLVIADVLPPKTVKGKEVIQTTNHSYFSRMVESSRFERLALVETQRRGVETAAAVAAVTDGAEWLQGFIDQHCHDARRILDFPHAAEYVNTIAQLLWSEQPEQKAPWLREQLCQLKEKGAGVLLATLRQETAKLPQTPELTTAMAYLEKRKAHMDYPAFQAEGWPIGSGAVESANKLVVEARLKGSGMHWARPHVNPMLALRNIVCNDRWEEAWPQITASLRQQARQASAQRRQHRSSLASPSASTPLPALAALHFPADSPLPPLLSPTTPTLVSLETPTQPAPRQPWRPAANHPWRRLPIGRTRFNPSPSTLVPKL